MSDKKQTNKKTHQDVENKYGDLNQSGKKRTGNIQALEAVKIGIRVVQKGDRKN